MPMVALNNAAVQFMLISLNHSSAKISKNSKKIASGMKINSSGDDASGYSISERMRVRIRSLGQAKENAKTGKDMMELASSAIDQQISIMKKVYSRTLQASDDTYTDIDRVSLQKEVGQLMDQVESIAQETMFNGMPLLNHSHVTQVNAGIMTFDANAAYVPNPSKIIALSQLKNGQYIPSTSYMPIYSWQKFWDPVTDQLIQWPPAVGQSISLVDPKTDPGHLYKVTVTETPYKKQLAWAVSSGGIEEEKIDFHSLFSSGLNIPEDLSGCGFSMDCEACDQFISIAFNATTDASTYYEGKTGIKHPEPICYSIGIKSVTDEQSLMNAVYNGISSVSPKSLGSKLPSSTNVAVQLADVHDVELAYDAVANQFYLCRWATSPRMILRNGMMGALVPSEKKENSVLPEQNLYLQTNDTASQNTKINIPNTTLSILFPDADSGQAIEPTDADYPSDWSADYANCKNETERRKKWREEVWQYPSEGIKFSTDNCVRTREQAKTFLDHVNQSIKYLLYSNTTLGAQSQRMDYTIKNLDISMEAVQNSEATIRDLDMAKEYTSYVKNNILLQASQAMLAQANQKSDKILSLLL